MTWFPSTFCSVNPAPDAVWAGELGAAVGAAAGGVPTGAAGAAVAGTAGLAGTADETEDWAKAGRSSAAARVTVLTVAIVRSGASPAMRAICNTVGRRTSQRDREAWTNFMTN